MLEGNQSVHPQERQLFLKTSPVLVQSPEVPGSARAAWSSSYRLFQTHPSSQGLRSGTCEVPQARAASSNPAAHSKPDSYAGSAQLTVTPLDLSPLSAPNERAVMVRASPLRSAQQRWTHRTSETREPRSPLVLSGGNRRALETALGC